MRLTVPMPVGFATVEAEPIDIGFAVGELAIHQTLVRSPFHRGDEMNYTTGNGYTISHIASGGCIGTASTREDAIEYVSKRLAAWGEDAYRRKCANSVAMRQELDNKAA